MRNGLHTLPDDTRMWYLNGKLHRTDGPAVERADGTKMWYLDDKLHRSDGPAVEWTDGSYCWYLYGKFYTFTHWLEANTALTEEHKLMMKLEYR